MTHESEPRDEAEAPPPVQGEASPGHAAQPADPDARTHTVFGDTAVAGSSRPSELEPHSATQEAEPHEPISQTTPEITPEAPASVAPMESAEALVANQPSEPEVESDTPLTAGGAAKDEVIEIAKTIGYALLIAMVLRIFLFQPFTIPSASMEPNLYEGDYIIVSKWDYGYSRHSIPFSPQLFKGRIFNHAPERGDIVVFKLPSNNKTDYIKRVIGLPGDTIQMREGQLYINDKLVPLAHLGKPAILPPAEAQFADIQEYREALPQGRTHLIQDFGPNGPLDNTAVYRVPPGYYFMMGDNRDNSSDSRVPMAQGGVDYVPAENLEGRGRVILFSWHEGASLWKPWTWITKLRISRFFHILQ